MIKRIISLVLSGVMVMAIIAGFSGCRYIPNGDHKASDKMEQQVLEALSNRDSEAIKSLFSKKALEKAEDLDENIERAFAFFEGTIISAEQHSWSSGESLNYGLASKHVDFRLDVTTSKRDYIIYIIYYYEDTIDPNNQGLYALSIMNPRFRGQFQYWDDIALPGVTVYEKKELDNESYQTFSE